MHIYRKRPSATVLRETLFREQAMPFSYAAVGAVTKQLFPAGFDHDRNRCLLGEGPAIFAAAKLLIKTYQHFPGEWTFVYADGAVPLPELTLTTTFRQFGLWWINGLRVVEVIDRPDFYGFSYGTLTSHVECGEELFYAELLPDGKVYYGIKAFSRPRFWGARLLKPYARSQQRRFVRESMAQMQLLVANASKHEQEMV